MTSSDRFDDLVAAYALDAVDTDERRAFAAVLADDPDLQRELADVRAVAAILAEAVEGAPSTPSPRVWEGIASSIAGERRRAQCRSS